MPSLTKTKSSSRASRRPSGRGPTHENGSSGTGSAGNERSVQALLESISRSQATIEFEVDGTIISANQNFLDTLKYPSVEQIRGKHHRIFCDKAYAASAEYQEFWSRLRSGEFVSGEFRRIDSDGKDVWIQASYNPVLDASGKVIRVFKVASDITSRKQQQEKAELEQSRLKSMVENAPINIMMADLDFTITYVNPSSVATLKTLERFLPVRADQVLGSKIDIFHKDPSVQRKVLSDPRNLPHKTLIVIGDQRAELLATAVRDEAGRYIGPMVTWSVVTERERLEREQARLSSMVENAPINIMMADIDLKIVFMNPASLKTLRSIEHLLPVKAGEVVGQSVDIFHKNPAHQRKLLSDPRNLPHRAKIKLGEETLDLLATAIVDAQGKYIGPMVTWSVVTDRLRIYEALKHTSATLAASATELSSSSQQMSESVGMATRQSESVAAATEQADRNAQVVAASAAEMASAVGEIARNMQQTNQMTSEAVRSAEQTNQVIAKLGTSSQKIGTVVKLITSIAQQTNLLALNATIEAARAGEAGKGFAVVANEVKELAKQTAKATDEIASQVEAIQTDAKTSVEAIGTIARIIEQINAISTTVASATEEQSSTTDDITRNIQQLAGGTKDIAQNILGVTEAARTSGQVATGVSESAESLSKLASELQALVRDFQV